MYRKKLIGGFADVLMPIYETPFRCFGFGIFSASSFTILLETIVSPFLNNAMIISLSIRAASFHSNWKKVENVLRD